MTVYDFQERLTMSQGAAAGTSAQTIIALLDGCVGVVKTDLETDRTGIDYIATLRGGAEVWIDLKTREPGCSRYWNGEPELALEKWSVIPTEQNKGKAGWTLDEAKKTHYILYTFDPTDSDRAYLLPFQLLRLAFRQNARNWWRQYKNAPQDSGAWQSSAVFVPASVVIAAITKEMESDA